MRPHGVLLKTSWLGIPHGSFSSCPPLLCHLSIAKYFSILLSLSFVLNLHTGESPKFSQLKFSQRRRPSLALGLPWDGWALSSYQPLPHLRLSIHYLPHRHSDKYWDYGFKRINLCWISSNQNLYTCIAMIPLIKHFLISSLFIVEGVDWISHSCPESNPSCEQQS